MERELQLYGYGFPSPQVRLYCAIKVGEAGRHTASEEMGSNPALPLIQCGTFTEPASVFVPVFSTCKMRVIIPTFSEGLH